MSARIASTRTLLSSRSVGTISGLRLTLEKVLDLFSGQPPGSLQRHKLYGVDGTSQFATRGSLTFTPTASISANILPRIPAVGKVITALKKVASEQTPGHSGPDGGANVRDSIQRHIDPQQPHGAQGQIEQVDIDADTRVQKVLPGRREAIPKAELDRVLLYPQGDGDPQAYPEANTTLSGIVAELKGQDWQRSCSGRAAPTPRSLARFPERADLQLAHAS